MPDTTPALRDRTVRRSGRRAFALPAFALPAGALLAGALLGALLGACAAAPTAPFVPTGLSVKLTQHAGSAITGPLSEASIAELDQDPAHALSLHGRAVLLEHFPHAQAPHLASQTTLLLTTPGSRPVLAVSRLGAGASRVPADEAAAFLAALDAGALGPDVPLGEVAATLPGGVTVALRLSSAESVGLQTVALLLSRDADDAGDADAAIRAALVFDGEVPERDADSTTSLVRATNSDARATASGASAASAAAPELSDDEEVARLVHQREGLYLSDGPTAGGAPLVVVVPLPQPGAPDAAAVLVWSLAPASAREPSQHAADVAATFEAVREATVTQRELASALTDNESYLRGMLAALGSLDVEGRERAALVFLAGASGAALAEDLALVGDDATLLAYIERVQAEAAALEDQGERAAALGWLLESAAYRMFITAAEERPLPPGLASLLLRHAGEVGRFPGTLEELLASCRDVDMLRQRLLLENLQFLRDSNPVSRVRAFDWLAQREAAPSGYDPLGSPDARRAALERAEEAALVAPVSDDGAGASAAPEDLP